MTSDDMPKPDDAPDKAGALLVRDASGRFRKGASGNPRGAPRGSRHWATRMAEALIDGQGDEIVRITIQKALNGEDAALKICMERLLPPRKSRPARFDLPPVVDAAGLLAAHAEILRAAAAGELSAEEASEISDLFQKHRVLIEFVEIATKVAAIEARLAGVKLPMSPDHD